MLWHMRSKLLLKRKTTSFTTAISAAVAKNIVFEFVYIKLLLTTKHMKI